jgi:predicted PolB exonuclease-like 3'-5' exonuclease
MKVFIDIETIPSQDPAVSTRIADSFPAISEPDEPRCPLHFKKAETIDAWEKETLPRLRATALLRYHQDCTKRETAIEDAWRKTALDGSSGEIICIAWAIEDNEPSVLSRTLTGSEAELLNAFFSVLHKQLDQRHAAWVGHHVTFDLRFLFQRAVILGVKPPFPLWWEAKPWGEHLQDTMVMWAGVRDKISLNRLCDALNLPSKGDPLGEHYIDGSLVWDFVKLGKIQEVSEYCQGDVTRCREVYKRLCFIDQISTRLNPILCLPSDASLCNHD